jgi:hypothetical protein
MFNLIQRKIVEVGREKAKEFLALNTYPGQRKMRPQHIKRLVRKIQNGLFLTGDVAIAQENYNGRQRRLVNGQHQLTSVVITGKPIYAVVEEYACSTPEDLALLYRQFDRHGSRTITDIATPEAIARGIDWPKSIVKLVIHGATLKEGKRDEDPDDRVALLRKYIKAGNFINKLLTGNGQGHLKRSATIAAMLCTFERSQDASVKFWTKVKTGENLTKTMPTYKLREYLLTHNLTTGRALRTQATKPTNNHEMLSKCITAWNAFRKGQSTNLAYFPNKPVPKAI